MQHTQSLPIAPPITGGPSVPSSPRRNGWLIALVVLAGAFLGVLILHVTFVIGVMTFKSMVAVNRLDKASAAASETAAIADRDSELAKSAAQARQTPLPTTYHCKKGDTLAKVSGLYNIPIAEICAANNWNDKWPLHVDQIITIPAPKPVVDAETAHKSEAGGSGGKTYTVKKGDNLVSIARALRVSYDDLLKLNNIDNPKKLQVGAVLQVPAARKKDPDHS